MSKNKTTSPAPLTPAQQALLDDVRAFCLERDERLRREQENSHGTDCPAVAVPVAGVDDLRELGTES